MKNASIRSRLALLSALILLPIAIGTLPARSADKLRVGVVGLAYKGGHKARVAAQESQEVIADELSKDARLSVKQLDPKILEKHKVEITANGKAIPSEILNETDLVIVAQTWFEKKMFEVRLEFIKSDTGRILKTIRVHERHDYSMRADIRSAVTKEINDYLAQPPEAAPASPAAVEQKVRARGVGVIPIQDRPVQMARRGALVLAQRDAAERALGAVVDLTVVPDTQLREIVATLQAQVQNVQITVDERRGDAYVIELTADVIIPPDIASQVPPPPPKESTNLKPAIQSFPKGSINWENGTIIARGTGRLAGGDTQSIEMANRAAKLDAYASAMEIVNGIGYDVETKVSDVVKAAPKRSYHIRALVQGAEVTQSKQLDSSTVQVTIEAPLRGIRGIASAFEDLFRLQPAAPPPSTDEPEPTPEESGTTGLIIDARKKGLMPAICPVIVDEKGNVIYGVGQLPRNVMLQRGAAAYVIEETSGPHGAWLGPNPLKIEALRIEPEPLQIAAADFHEHLAFSILHPRIYLAQAAQKVVLRQGKQAIHVTAAAASGPQKARVTVSKSDGDKIRRTNKKTNYLSEARVVIITDSMVGATEGRRPEFPSKTLSRTELFYRQR